MVHVWELIYAPAKNHSKNWYHSKAFREKIKLCGIICKIDGNHKALLTNGRFVHLLIQHGIKIDLATDNLTTLQMLTIDNKLKIKGKSKLRKWSCGCQNVRVGKKYFRATCDMCGNKFLIRE
jgi:hypothetical protein